MTKEEDFKDFEDSLDNMSEEEFQDFLKRTHFEFYDKIKTPVFDYLDSIDDKDN